MNSTSSSISNWKIQLVVAAVQAVVEEIVLAVSIIKIIAIQAV